MTVVHPSPSPGWYPDPEGRAEKRWWDGSTWTGSYAPVAPVAPAPSTAPVQLTSLEQLAALPSGPGYTSLLASLPPVPAYVERQTPPAPTFASAPTPTPGYASAPPPSFTPMPGSMAQPPALNGYPAPQSTPFLAISANPDVATAEPAAGASPYAPAFPPATQQSAFTPPAAWAPPAPVMSALPAVPTTPAHSAPSYPTDEFHPRAATDSSVDQRPRGIGAHSVEAPASIFTPTPVDITAAANRLPDVFTPSKPFSPGSPFELSYVSPSYTAASPVSLDDGPTYEPFALGARAISAAPVGPPERAMTSSVWLMAATPLLTFGAMIALVLWLPDFYSRFAQLGLLAIFVVATLGFAVNDVKELRSMGHLRPASAGWVVLSPLAYLLARGVRTSSTSRAAFAPFLLVTVTIALLVAAVVVVLPEWVAALLVATAG